MFQRGSWKWLDLPFFHQALNFLKPEKVEKRQGDTDEAKKFSDDQIKETLKLLTGFVTLIKKGRTNSDKQELEKLESLELFLANKIVFFYSKLGCFDELNKFILLYDSGVTSRQIFGDFYPYLELLVFGNPQAVPVMINVYGIQQNYKKAVELSLQHRQEELAIKWAEKNGVS